MLREIVSFSRKFSKIQLKHKLSIQFNNGSVGAVGFVLPAEQLLWGFTTNPKTVKAEDMKSETIFFSILIGLQ